MLVTVIGARPQFVKAAVVSRALKDIGIEEEIIHTGQHYDEDMSAVFWKELNIPPFKINLNVGSGSHGDQTAQMMIRIEEYLIKRRSTIKGIVLYGDTNSTIAGSIVASKLGIPIVHIEAGLRSFNRSMPEEINRVVTDHLSDVLFCPSPNSVTQLKLEGITRNVFDVGDVMYDAVRVFGKMAEHNTTNDLLKKEFNKAPFNLLTVHRPSNTDHPDNLAAILAAIAETGKKTIWPVHPRTRKIMDGINGELPGNLVLVSPFSYFEMLTALKKCKKVITDSGGLQKEAYWMKKPCVTLRNETEWVETLHNNWNILTGPDTDKVIRAENTEITLETWKPLYGEGDASRRIAEKLRELLYA
jgi:UDP-N-acetylglucosamine 2-epimerase